MVLAVVASSPLTVGFATRHEHSLSVSMLHKAIRDHRWDEIKDTLHKNPSLIFQVNSRGWNALHVAATSRPYGSWWKWLLEIAAREKTADFAVTNDTGHTVLDLYYRSTLHPLPWQRNSMQQQADSLTTALESMLDNPSLLEQVQTQLQREFGHYPTTRDNDYSAGSVSDVDRICLFWQTLLLLLEAAHSSRSMGDVATLECLPVLQLLAASHWCPYLVATSAAHLFPHQIRQEPLPLHIWCQTPKIHQWMTWPNMDTLSNGSILHTDNSQSSMLKILCQEYPEGAAKRIGAELPLSVALRHGKSWRELQPLFHAQPAATTGSIPIFAIPAFYIISDIDAEWAAKRQDPQRLSVWCYLSRADKRRAIQQARELLELRQLETIFELLRLNPVAIMALFVE